MRHIINFRLLDLVVFFSLNPLVASGTTLLPIELSGLQLRAGVIALLEFEKQSYDIKNYKILIRSASDLTEVVFIPNISINGESIRGGENSFGKGIHYFISNLGKIEKVTFAK